MNGQDLVSYTARGVTLRMQTRPGVEVTPFSVMLADSLTPPAGVVAAADAGAGSGFLAILLARLAVPHVHAVERSEMACEIAADNVRRNGVEDQVTIWHDELSVVELPAPVDFVVSNPPTIPEAFGQPAFVKGAGEDGVTFLDELVGFGVRWSSPRALLQTVISSLVDQRRFALQWESVGWHVCALASRRVAVRPFYRGAYGNARMSEFLQEGRLRRSPEGEVTEELTVYEVRGGANAAPCR